MGARGLSRGRLRAVAAVAVGDGGAGWDGARRQVGEGPRNRRHLPRRWSVSRGPCCGANAGRGMRS